MFYCFIYQHLKHYKDYLNNHFLTGVRSLLDFRLADFPPFSFFISAPGSFSGLAEENRHTEDKNREQGIYAVKDGCNGSTEVLPTQKNTSVIQNMNGGPAFS